MIKILTGWSDRGGSTTALIELTNLFNNSGYEARLYGPHHWHLDKCKSGLLDANSRIQPEDYVIIHFLQLPQRPECKRIVLSCHEKNVFEVGKIKQFWDTCIFLNNKHKEYHNQYKGSFAIIPNIKSKLLPKDKPELNLIAGIIGSIDVNKQTHVSIQRALYDGCIKIKLFGSINDTEYYNKFVLPLINENHNTIDGIIFNNDKQEIYNSIGRVYHSSFSEVACLVKDECYATNTKFFGNHATSSEVSKLTDDEILEKWKKVLKLN